MAEYGIVNDDIMHDYGHVHCMNCYTEMVPDDLYVPSRDEYGILCFSCGEREEENEL